MDQKAAPLKEAPSRVAETEYGTIRWYGVVRVDAIHLAASAPFSFKSSDVGADNLGALFTSGALVPNEGNPYPGQSPADGWQEPFVWREPGQADYTASLQGAAWLCLSNTRGNSLTVEHHSIRSAFTVPFDWGYVVASGTVTDGSEQGAPGDYFAPGNLDREVTGTGDLLLVR